MKVWVTTVVTDQAGKVKERHQSAVTMIFHGYNLQTGSFSLRSNSGWFNTGALQDSPWRRPDGIHLGGLPDAVQGGRSQARNLAGQTRSHRARHELSCTGVESEMAVSQSDLRDRPIHSGPRSRRLGVSAFRIREFRFARDCQDQVSGECAPHGLPRHSGLPGEFPPGRPQAFLWPKTVVTTLTTDKGSISVTNQYSSKR